MKVLPFIVPKTYHQSFHVQIDDDMHFYDSLHSHPEIQITYVQKSSGTLVAGSYTGNFVPGQLYIIGSGQPHVFKNDPEYFQNRTGLRAYGISIFIRKDLFGHAFMQLPEMNRINQLIQLSERNLSFGKDIIGNILPIIRKLIKQEGLHRLISLLEILEILSRTDRYELLTSEIIQKKMNENEGKRLNDIYQFSFHEFHRTIALKEVASLANMTIPSFCRYFKSRTRKSYSYFLNEIRVGNSCRLLQNKDLSISDIAYSSGFTNLSNFNRQFKAITGKSPKEYRNSF